MLEQIGSNDWHSGRDCRRTGCCSGRVCSKGYRDEGGWLLKIKSLQEMGPKSKKKNSVLIQVVDKEWHDNSFL